MTKLIKFIGEQAQTGHSDRKLTTDHALSGQNELDKMKNVYDLEGNYLEWTVEACSTNNRARRGGLFFEMFLGIFDPASNRDNGGPPTVASYSFSSRSTLYI